jgi:N-acetylneuraminic acid mutarotase
MAGSAAATLATAACAPAAQWFPAAPMREPRAAQTATLLPNGEVLVAGGYHTVAEGSMSHDKSSQSAELFNPTTNTWRPATPMLARRSGSAATLLTNGDVLIVGGGGYTPTRSGEPEATAETYDPSTNTWTPFPLPPELREFGELVLLPSGWLFALGWFNAKASKPTQAGALYNPATDTWERTAAPAHPRHSAALALLKDGNILMIGGFISEPYSYSSSLMIDTAQDVVEEYDPSTSVWRALEPMNEARIGETATVLADEDVFVDGGIHSSLPFSLLENGVSGAEQYDPAANRWVSLAPMAEPRAGQTTTLLADGSLLVTGGDQCGTGGCGAASAELYEPNTDSWTFTPPVTTGQEHTATLLPNGDVFVTGGSVGTGGRVSQLSSAEIYAERYPPDETTAPGPTGVGSATTGASPTTPRIERISQSHKRWRERHGGSATRTVGHKGPPVGTTFTVTLSEAAKVSLTFAQVQHGHRVHDSTFSFAGHAGTNKIAFAGRIGNARMLALGAHTVTIVASNADGRSAAKRLSFTVVR